MAQWLEVLPVLLPEETTEKKYEEVGWFHG